MENFITPIVKKGVVPNRTIVESYLSIEKMVFSRKRLYLFDHVEAYNATFISGKWSPTVKLNYYGCMDGVQQHPGNSRNGQLQESK